jgi:hypothetical protein
MCASGVTTELVSHTGLTSQNLSDICVLKVEPKFRNSEFDRTVVFAPKWVYQVQQFAETLQVFCKMLNIRYTKCDIVAVFIGNKSGETTQTNFDTGVTSNKVESFISPKTTKAQKVNSRTSTGNPGLTSVYDSKTTLGGKTDLFGKCIETEIDITDRPGVERLIYQSMLPLPTSFIISEKSSLILVQVPVQPYVDLLHQFF